LQIGLKIRENNVFEKLSSVRIPRRVTIRIPKVNRTGVISMVGSLCPRGYLFTSLITAPAVGKYLPLPIPIPSME